MRATGIVLAFVFCSANVASGNVLSEPGSLDMGRTKTGQVVEAKAKIVNNSNVAINILSISADCGCTTATMQHQKIEPGYSEVLTVLVSAGTAPGELRRNVTVESTDGKVVIPLRLFVTEHEKWEIEPSVLVMRDQTSKASLRYIGKGPMHLGAVTGSPDVLNIAVNERAENHYELVFAKKDPRSAEFRSVKVSVATSDKEDSTINLVVFIPQSSAGKEASTGQSDSALRAHPSSLNLSSVEVGQSANGQFSLAGWRQASRPRISAKHGRVLLKEETGTELRYEIVWIPPIVGYLSNTVSIFDGDMLKLEIPVTVRSLEKKGEP